jgi:hypothetical protein
MQPPIKHPSFASSRCLLQPRGRGHGKIESDLDDAVALMKVTKLATEQQLGDVLTECYANLPAIVVPTANPRIKAKIETLLYAYRKAESEPDPTRHADTGPATRP